jgi:hypothetical protein
VVVAVVCLLVAGEMLGCGQLWGLTAGGRQLAGLHVPLLASPGTYRPHLHIYSALLSTLLYSTSPALHAKMSTEQFDSNLDKIDTQMGELLEYSISHTPPVALY